MKIKHHNPPQNQVQKLISQGLHPVLAKIYAVRGVNDFSDTEYKLANLPHPDTLKGAKEAGELLAYAIQNNISMIIAADYDCDGATACALAIKGIKLLAGHQQADIDFVVPNRFVHGYGLTPEIVDLALAKMPQAKLLITVDNGISSIEGVEYANSKNMQVLITDHHLSSKDLPDAAVIVNPNQPRCNFISKNIAGVGVMFYVLMATRTALKNHNFYIHGTIPRLDKLLDLVALGTVADVVKLDAVNRCFVHNGLQRMRNNIVQHGIKSIVQAAGRELNNISSFDLGFAVGPRLNAAGRIDDMSLGINCLISEDADYTQNTASILNKLNLERKNIETDIKEEINLHLDEIKPQHKAICLYGEDWHQGVIGIVASRFKDKYHLPTLIFAQNSKDDDGLIKGSGRSITGFHMRDAIDAVSKMHPHIITKFGGHAMAAGLTIKHEYFEQFCQSFYAYAEQNLSEEHLQNIIYIDEELQEQDHTFELANLIQQQVWGQGFSSPLFANHFKVIEQKILKEQHLKLKLALGSTIFEAIYFFNNLQVNDNIYAAYELSINNFRGKQMLQLLIKYIE